MAHLGNKGPLGLKPDNAGRAAKFAIKKGAASEPAALKALTKRVSPPSGLGETVAKPPKKRKPVRKVSAKRAAYLASPERTAGKAHMARVALLPCLVCGAHGVEVHHEGKPRNDMHVLPLCPRHHRREFNEGAFHYSPKAFYALHGDSASLLARVAAMLQK